MYSREWQQVVISAEDKGDLQKTKSRGTSQVPKRGAVMKVRVHLSLLSTSTTGKTGQLHKACFFPPPRVQEQDTCANNVMAGKFI